MSAARRVLERLLRKGERARAAGREAPVSLPMTTAASAGEYLALRTLEEQETFHAQIALAERDGAIAVRRDRHRGDGARLLRIAVRDLAALARHLGVEPAHARADAAAAALSPWIGRFPVLAQVLDAWRQGRKVRGRGPEAAPELADAARAAAALAPAAAERILRMESARLFGDSKRLERLTPWLDLLLAGELAPSGLQKEAVWAQLGLRRVPLPLLLSGCGTVRLDDGSELPLPRPFLGVPVEAVRSVRTPAAAVLSIENLASFHQAAAEPDAPRLLLLYTGGMPSPAWRAVYARILRGLAPDVAVYHWGDIDAGGFRIAALLARTAGEAGAVLRPWRMSPGDLPADALAATAAPSAATLSSMLRAAEAAGWNDVAQALRRTPRVLEQERLDPGLPALLRDLPAPGRVAGARP
ncbi:Wadjet anti-phage system protein JetD domain-containing protein [Luteimonas huabeiensis]|uniref:Wadjet anti-phage system protein JetD domain-containing protein n=1 Tax=Luteimonas huabeiensis TaxID=1244513 RepID=UPI0004674BD1|nr:Wadjet anti-phage system protein JetD domain-containing protein [Luteimonas huabeiensis]